MRRCLILFGLLPLILAGTGVGLAQNRETSTSRSPSFESFRLILDRNIFDPNRKPPMKEGDTVAATQEALPPSQTLDLRGTWVFGKNKIAFIDGNSANGKTEISEGDTFDSIRVERITTTDVLLTSGGQQLVWPVGQRIERHGEGEWRLAGMSSPASSTPDTASAVSGSTSAPPTGSSEDEILRKLMERRQQEIRR